MPRTLLALLAWTTVGCAPVLGIEETVVDSCTLAPTRIFFPEKVASDTSVVIGMVTRLRLDEMVSERGTIDDTLGHVVVLVTDCAGNPVEDATVTIDPASMLPFTADEGRIVAGTDASESGILGAFNVNTPGEVDLEAFPPALGESASCRADLDSFAGEVAFMQMRPNGEGDVLAMEPAGFECTGDDPVPPTAEVAKIDIEVRGSTDFTASGAGLEGVRLRACVDGTDCFIDLDAPPATGDGVTDASGRGSVDVSTGFGMDENPEGFDGSVLVWGRLPGCGF